MHFGLRRTLVLLFVGLAFAFFFVVSRVLWTPTCETSTIEIEKVGGAEDETLPYSFLEKKGRLFQSWQDVPTVWRHVDFLIVGAGLSGAVLAERLASQMGKRVLVIEKRHHIAGNCFDFYAKDTGILMNRYGAHLFHTNNEKSGTTYAISQSGNVGNMKL